MQKKYSVEAVAAILADITGEKCACNINNNDEWLPQCCSINEASCPNPGGNLCWEEYLKNLPNKPN